MANTIYQSRDCDVYCLELDELDGLQIVVKGHNYCNFKRDNLTDHNGNISYTVHRLPSQDTCMTQSSHNFKCKYSPSSILLGRKIPAQSENSTAGGKNITAHPTTVESIITTEQTSNATNVITDPTSNATNVTIDPTFTDTITTSAFTFDEAKLTLQSNLDGRKIIIKSGFNETNLATLSSPACSGKKNITKSLTSEITQQTNATGCNFKLSAGSKMIIQSTSSNIECEKQMERRRNQLQRCSFTDNRPASHSQPEIHEDKRPYACDLCEKRFRWRSNLSVHKRIHTSHKLNQCIECGKTFGSKDKLGKHLKTHKEEITYTCSKCASTFKQKSSLMCHLRTHENIKPYQCTRCNEEVSRKGHVQQHWRVHTVTKPYTCRICGKEYISSSALNNHFRLQYKCCENKQCMYSVSSDTPMSKSTKSYKCSMCEKQFSHDSNLYAHLKIHDWCQNVKSSTNIDNILTLPAPSITTSTAQQTCSIAPNTTLTSTTVIANTIQRSSGIAKTATPSAFVEGNTSEPSTTSSNGILKSISVINSTNLTTSDFINIPELPTVGSIATPENIFDHKTMQCLPLFDSKIMSATPGNFVDHDTTRCLPPVDSKIRSATPENCFNHETTHCLPPVDPKIMSASLSNSGGFNKSRTSANVNTQTSISTRLNKKHLSTCNSFVSNISSLSAPVSAVPHRPNIKKRSTRVGSNMKPSTCDRSNRTVSSNSGRRKSHSKLHAFTDLNKCNKGKKLYSPKNYLERPYNCTTCKGQFIRKYDLERHTRMHTGDKPYECKECGKRFPENYRLQSHRKTHKISYQSECPVCGKLYLQQSTLQTHMKIHYWRQTI